MAQQKNQPKRRRPQPVKVVENVIIPGGVGLVGGVMLNSWAPSWVGPSAGIAIAASSGTSMVAKKNKLKAAAFGLGMAAPGAIEFIKDKMPAQLEDKSGKDAEAGGGAGGDLADQLDALEQMLKSGGGAEAGGSAWGSASDEAGGTWD